MTAKNSPPPIFSAGKKNFTFCIVAEFVMQSHRKKW